MWFPHIAGWQDPWTVDMWRVKPCQICQADRESCQFPHTTCEISSYIKADTEFRDIESPFPERTHFLSSSTPAVFRFFFLTTSIGFNKRRINWVSEDGGTPKWPNECVFWTAAQETTCHLSPDFQKVVLWNARLRSIAIRSGQRTPTSGEEQQTHRNMRSHQKATANQTCPDSRGNFQVISKCLFPGWFLKLVVFPVWNTLKHIEIWYRHRWIDLQRKNFDLLDLIWAVSIETGDSNGKMAPKNVVNIWFFMGWSVGFHHQDAVTSTPPPLAPQWGLASLLDLLLLPLGLMVCITLYRVTAVTGGGWIAVRWFPRWERCLSFFKTQSHSSSCKTHDRPMSLRFMNLLSSHSWFMDVLLTPNMIIIGFWPIFPWKSATRCVKWSWPLQRRSVWLEQMFKSIFALFFLFAVALIFVVISDISPFSYEKSPFSRGNDLS